jgi:hypothetical protein
VKTVNFFRPALGEIKVDEAVSRLDNGPGVGLVAQEMGDKEAERVERND